MSPEFRKGALKALAPAALGFGYLLWRYGGTLPTSARFWGLLALVVGPEIVGTLASDYLIRTGRVVVGKLVGLAGVVWLIGGCTLLATKTNAATLTDAERVPFVSVEDEGEVRLRHPTLGFSILHPGPGFTPDIAQAFSRDAQFYSFVDPGAAARLVVGLFKDQGESSASLRKLLERMGHDADALSGGAAIPARVVGMEIAPADPPRGSLQIVLGDGRHFRVTAHGWRAPDGTPFAILVAMMARAPEAGADVLASFRP